MIKLYVYLLGIDPSKQPFIDLVLNDTSAIIELSQSASTLTSPATTTSTNLNNPTIDGLRPGQMSPSAAVRLIVKDVFQQYIRPQSDSSPTNSRVRSAGKYGEEITSSGRLDELKGKATMKSNSITRKKKSISEQSPEETDDKSGSNTANKRKKQRSLKKLDGTITLLQAMNAVSTVTCFSSNDLSTTAKNN